MSEGFVERSWRGADGVALAARDYAGASGPARLPVVCLHGLTRNARDFEALAPRVGATGRRVLAPDVRGRGRSGWAPEPSSYALPTYVSDLRALLAAAGIGRAVFVGTSMGGLMLHLLALQAPGLIAATVLNDVGAVVAPQGLARIAAYAGAPVDVTTWKDAAGYARRLNAEAFPAYAAADWDAFARRLFREDERGRPVLDYDPAIATPLRAAPSGSPTAAVAPPDLWPAFDALAAAGPLLLVRGEASDILAPDTAEEMGRRAPGLTRVAAADVGHAPMLDEPDVLPALLAFLARVD